jgi:hypothetical protein
MAFLNQIINAVLTKTGRALLAKGDPAFKITKFALGDDEIDYSLWNTNHPSGSDYYGESIERTPVFEALPDDTIVMRSKLITLPKGVTSIPYVVVSPKSMTLTFGQKGLVQPSTLNGAPGYDDSYAGYTCILHNQAIATLTATKKPQGKSNIVSLPSDVLDDAVAINAVYDVGLEFQITAKDVTTIGSNLRTALITIIGNESGTLDTLELIITPPPDRNVQVS